MKANQSLCERYLPTLEQELSILKRRYQLTSDLADEVRGEMQLRLVEASTKTPPDGVAEEAFFRMQMRWAALDLLKRRGRVRSTVSLHQDEDDESSYPLQVADTRASDPAEIVAASEALTVRRPTLSEVEQRLPSATYVADKAVQLRAAMFAAVSVEAIQQVMQGVVARAIDGSHRDVKLLVDMVSAGKSGVTINQQAIVVQQGDLS